MTPIKDGASCPGCGLANYEGLCPHCLWRPRCIRERTSAALRDLVPGGALAVSDWQGMELVGLAVWIAMAIVAVVVAVT